MAITGDPFSVVSIQSIASRSVTSGISVLIRQNGIGHKCSSIQRPADRRRSDRRPFCRREDRVEQHNREQGDESEPPREHPGAGQASSRSYSEKHAADARARGRTQTWRQVLKTVFTLPMSMSFTTTNSTASVRSRPTSASTSVMLQRTGRRRSAALALLAGVHQQADERRDIDDHGRHAQPERGDDEGEDEAGERGGDPEAVSPRRLDQSGLQRAQPPNLVPTAYVQAQARATALRLLARRKSTRNAAMTTKRKSPWMVR